jgi:hypothetical protein
MSHESRLMQLRAKRREVGLSDAEAQELAELMNAEAQELADTTDPYVLVPNEAADPWATELMSMPDGPLGQSPIARPSNPLDAVPSTDRLIRPVREVLRHAAVPLSANTVADRLYGAVGIVSAQPAGTEHRRSSVLRERTRLALKFLERGGAVTHEGRTRSRTWSITTLGRKIPDEELDGWFDRYLDDVVPTPNNYQA